MARGFRTNQAGGKIFNKLTLFESGVFSDEVTIIDSFPVSSSAPYISTLPSIADGAICVYAHNASNSSSNVLGGVILSNYKGKTLYIDANLNGGGRQTYSFEITENSKYVAYYQSCYYSSGWRQAGGFGIIDGMPTTYLTDVTTHFRIADVPDGSYASPQVKIFKIWVDN